MHAGSCKLPAQTTAEQLDGDLFGWHWLHGAEPYDPASCGAEPYDPASCGAGEFPA